MRGGNDASAGVGVPNGAGPLLFPDHSAGQSVDLSLIAVAISVAEVSVAGAHLRTGVEVNRIVVVTLFDYGCAVRFVGEINNELDLHCVEIDALQPAAVIGCVGVIPERGNRALHTVPTASGHVLAGIARAFVAHLHEPFGIDSNRSRGNIERRVEFGRIQNAVFTAIYNGIVGNHGASVVRLPFSAAEPVESAEFVDLFACNQRVDAHIGGVVALVVFHSDSLADEQKRITARVNAGGALLNDAGGDRIACCRAGIQIEKIDVTIHRRIDHFGQRRVGVLIALGNVHNRDGFGGPLHNQRLTCPAGTGPSSQRANRLCPLLAEPFFRNRSRAVGKRIAIVVAAKGEYARNRRILNVPSKENLVFARVARNVVTVERNRTLEPVGARVCAVRAGDCNVLRQGGLGRCGRRERRRRHGRSQQGVLAVLPYLLDQQ